MKRIKTPVTELGMMKFDKMDSLDAALAAWNDPGKHPSWHKICQDNVRQAMPLLAKALDRASREK